jgi:hypothetical protein
MAEEYDFKSCHALAKIYYKPIEAALRWCNLIEHEMRILQAVGTAVLPVIGEFPQWPCLRVNAEKIYDAILNGDLVYGRDGRTVGKGEQVAKERLTVRHTDLKEWMIKNYPDQKPKFLFDEVERSTHSAINSESFVALQVENSAKQVRIDKLIKEKKAVESERDALEGERNSLRAMVDSQNQPGQRSETTYLNIIGAMLEVMLSKTPSGKSHSVFENQTAIIEALLVHYKDKPGISERTLAQKFADAKQSLAQ